LALLAGCGNPPEDVEPPPRVERGSHRPEAPPGFFGVNAAYVRLLLDGGDTAAADAHLEQISELGLDFVRADVGWREAQPESSDETSFESLDRWVAALASHGLRWQVLMVGTPTPRWAVDTGTYLQCGPQSPPADPAHLANFAGVFAERYGEGGTFWAENPDLPELPVVDYEVWNEPNFGAFWCPEPDPVAYAELYAAVGDAVRAVNSSHQSLIGGLVSFRDSDAGFGETPRTDAATFLQGMVEARPGLIDEVDGIAVHAYETDVAGVLDTLAWYRDSAVGAGLEDVPFSLNEIGWYTAGSLGGGSPLTEEDRAALLADVAEQVPRTDCGVESLAPYTWATAQADTANAEDWFGVADPVTGEPKATAITYSNAAITLSGRAEPEPPREPIDAC
jgi:hypothetical protein